MIFLHAGQKGVMQRGLGFRVQQIVMGRRPIAPHILRFPEHLCSEFRAEICAGDVELWPCRTCCVAIRASLTFFMHLDARGCNFRSWFFASADLLILWDAPGGWYKCAKVGWQSP